MPKKSRKRREAERRKLERAVEAATTPDEEAARLARARAKAEHEAERLRRKARREHAGGIPPLLVGVPVAAVLVVGVIVLVITLSGGSSGDDAPTDDPRLTPGVTPAVTLTMIAQGEEQGSTFSPDTLTIPAGEVVEIVVTNTAARVSHNLRVSGEDGEYQTDDVPGDNITLPKDDWLLPIVEKGQTKSLKLRMDTPGSYKFQCDFHPETQKGMLTVQ